MHIAIRPRLHTYAHLQMQHGHASQKTHIMCSLSSQSTGALAGPTENTLPIVACVHFGRGLEMDVLLLLRARQSRSVYRDIAWQ
jgi:hypothetical protein